MTTGTHDEGLGFDVEHKPEIKQYGVNDLSPVSETPVFTERMKWFAQQLKDHNVPEHIADAMMNPIHGNQAGFEASNKAMEEIEKAEIEREAEARWPSIEQSEANYHFNCQQEYNRQTFGRGVEWMQSRLSPLLLHSEQKLRDSTRLLELAGQRIKELEKGIWQISLGTEGGPETEFSQYVVGKCKKLLPHRSTASE